jgi:hypothetical protein
MPRTLQNDGLRYWTGRMNDGTQVIIGPAIPNIPVYLFDSAGKFTEKRVVPLNPKPRLNPSTNAYITDASFFAVMEAQICARGSRFFGDFDPRMA